MIHFIGVSGAFMSGLARLALDKGLQVSGSDANFDPPMGDVARALGCPLFSGYDADVKSRPANLYVVGNAISRGNPLMESVMREGRDYVSAPQFLCENVLRGRKVLAVAGSHGKTTTTALLAHILDRAGMSPGFLAGGILPSFGASARLGSGECFAIEGDEYDSAFFDKRPKFMHYRPQGAALNNLEFDHADIYANVDEIIRQFHYLLRTIPPDGKIVARAGDANLTRALQTGVYSPVDFFGGENDNENEDNNDNNPPNIRWRWRMNGDAMEVWDDGRLRASFIPPLPGAMNRDNILAAIALADWAGASADDAKNHLRDFAAPLRRLQFLGERYGVKVYDDFAHHPTAYAATIRALREAEPKSRLLAVFEPRSNTMKAGVFRAALAESLSDADIIIACKSAAKWNLQDALRDLGARATVVDNAGEALSQILAVAQKGDCVLTMSNGPFDGLAKKVLHGLAKN